MFKVITQKFRSIAVPLAKDRHSLKNKLIKGAAGSFGIQIGSNGLAFILSIIFARFLGTVGLGTYSYAVTWANLASIPATLGVDRLVVREMAVYRTKSQWQLMGGLLRWSNVVVLSFSLIFTIVATASIYLWESSLDADIVLAVILAMVTVPIASLRNVRQGAMQGLHRIILGQMPDALFGPAMVIVLTVIGYLLFPESFNVYWVLVIKLLAVITTFFIGGIWLWQSLPTEVKQVKPQYLAKQWLMAALPFMFLGTMQLINSRIDIIMLGGIQGVEAVGIYTIIVGITQLTIVIHQAANSVLGPTIATLYSENKLQELEQIIRKSVLIVFSVSLSIGVIMMVFGKYLLLIFGSEFVPGHTAMNILILGQVFHAFTGPVGLLLNMTGYQNYTAIAVGISAVLNIIFNALLIPQWGINGAAAATTASLIIINVLKVILTQRKLKISLSPFKLN